MADLSRKRLIPDSEHNIDFILVKHILDDGASEFDCGTVKEKHLEVTMQTAALLNRQSDHPFSMWPLTERAAFIRCIHTNGLDPASLMRLLQPPITKQSFQALCLNEQSSVLSSLFAAARSDDESDAWIDFAPALASGEMEGSAMVLWLTEL